MKKMNPGVANVRDWKPARQFPETYPGDCPSQSYLVLGENIYIVQYEHPLELWYTNEDGLAVKVDDALMQNRLPPVHDRYALLAYGANRNPATLRIKFENYDYRCPGDNMAVPVLRGEIYGADVVACALSGQGYLYGDLLFDTEWTRRAQTEVWVLLLDRDQLRAIHESEGVRTGDYIVARFDGVTIDNCKQAFAPMGYAAREPVLISPSLGSPLGFESVRSRGRAIPEMSPIGMIDHLLDAFDMRQPISHITGLANSGALASELSKYLNGQWWYQFNTQQPPIQGYREVMQLFRDRLKSNLLPWSTAHKMTVANQSLSIESSYRPDESFTFAALLG